MLLQGSARTFVLATAVLLALASHAPEARAQPTRVPGPVVDASRVAAERGGARLERAQCERTYRVNPPSHCYVQAFGRDGGAVEILSDEPDSRRGERLVLELQSGISVPAQNALLYEPRTRRLFVGDGMSIRVFDFERLEWRFVVACRAPVVAPDQTSIACLGMRGELVRVPASSDEGPWTVFAPEEPVRILARHRDWLEGHPLRFSVRRGVTVVTVSLPRDARECIGPVSRRGSVSCERVRGPALRYTVAWDGRPTPSPQTPLVSMVEAARGAFARGRTVNVTRRLEPNDCRDLIGMDTDSPCDVTRGNDAEALVVELCPHDGGWSPMCSSGRRRGWVVRDDRGTTHHVDVTPDVDLVALADDGHKALVSSFDGSWVYDLDTQTFELVGPCWNPTLSADGAWLACRDLGGGVRLATLRDPDTQLTVGEASLPSGQALGIAPTKAPMDVEIRDGRPVFLVPSTPYAGASGERMGADYADRWFRVREAELRPVVLESPP